MEQVTISIVNQNGIKRLPLVLDAIYKQDYPIAEVIVVDNASTDGTPQWLEEHYPQVRCIGLAQNQGANAGRQIGLEQAKTRYVLIMDNDMVLEPDAVGKMMHVITTVPRVGLCHAETKDRDFPESALHYNGGSIHYVGALVSRTHNDGPRPEYEHYDSLSGQTLLVERELALHIGGFDVEYFFGWTDADFTVRMSLAGYRCLNIPAAVGWHIARPRGTSKTFHQVRNRWYFMIKLYAWRTLILIIPMLVVYELSLMVLLLIKGAIKDYARGTLAAVHDLPMLLRKRRQFQRLKVKRDREWLVAGQFYIAGAIQNGSYVKGGFIQGRVQRAMLKGLNNLFTAYWKLVRPFC